jgi:DNA-binding SARP family transcriptional activator/tetratricopeptide (TPR) repeat protein
MIGVLSRSPRATRLEEPGGRISRTRLARRVRDALELGDVLLTAGAGCGKTTILDQALREAPTRIAWISCSDTERAPGTLLMRILDAIARAAPGASDALAERLAAAPEQIDALAATRELLAELPRLLVEPLILVIDDGEHLEGADRSLGLLSELIRSENPSLHVAVATRHSLDLRVAKPRVAGRLTELTAPDLAFDAEECASMLRARGGLDPSPERVAEVMEATEGWPLGIALAAAGVERAGRGGNGAVELRDLRSAPDLRAYLAEELLESLDPELREAAITSSVARVVTPEIGRALDLPEDFGRRIELAGVLMRRVDDGAFAYHPLLREFLLERLREERGPEELRRLNATVAPAVAEAGDVIGAVEHWIAAESWPNAVAAIEREGPTLVRTSPDLMRRWLSVLPAEVGGQPTIRSLEGQLEWGAGEHRRAVDAFRDAIRGFRDHPNPSAEWLARFVLSDSLFALGDFEAAAELVEGWDDPAAGPAGVLAPATVTYAAFCLAAIGRFEESDRLGEAAKRHPDAARLVPLQSIRLALHEWPRGDLAQAFARMEAAAREMERSDPFNRRFYMLVSLAIMLADCGRPDEALRMWMRVREGVRGGRAPFLVDNVRAWCALLHAQGGRLQDAETELAQQGDREDGWRSYTRDLAAACVASLRGDAAQTVASAESALTTGATAPILFRYWTGADLVPALAAVGRLDQARDVLDDTRTLVDEGFPGPLGRFPRSRLLALRSWLRYAGGDSAGGDDDLRLFWEEAGDTLPIILRREWQRLEAVVWDGLERGVLEPEPAIEAIGRAFPEGVQLVPFLNHPVASVRRAAVSPAVASGDPEALRRLGRLKDDPDRDLADAATRATETLDASLPPLRFELLGRFSVFRGSWRAGDTAWGRPIDARVVRFLLVHLERPVPEDLIIEALWPDLSASSAHNSLRVAVSRARRVVDPPGAERSVIESVDHAYRLVLGDRDLVDAEEFRSAADVALGERSGEQLRLLERARSLWRGEPLPEERYSDWAAGYRERLVDRHIAVLTALVDLHNRTGEHDRVTDVARELVEIDPLNEGGHRALIGAYARAGRTGHALRQYLECRRALVEQAGIEPAEETSRLQARILAGDSV